MGQAQLVNPLAIALQLSQTKRLAALTLELEQLVKEEEDAG